MASAALAASALAGEPAPRVGLDEVFARLAASHGVEARFEESKQVSLLAQPLHSRGVIYFAPPDRFARFTTEPEFSALVVEGDRVRLREGAGAEEIDLSGNRVARVFVENFVALWSGDRERLESLYTAEVRGTPDAWELRLAPRRAPLADAISAIVFSGDRDSLRELRVEERDGDRTLTRFVDARTDRRFRPEELARIFGAARPLDDGPAER